MKTIICIAAGLVAPLLWTALESALIASLPVASSHFVWRSIQILVASISALVLILPLAWLLRPTSLRLGLAFVASFVASEVAYQVVLRQRPQDFWGLFQLPDTWVFLGVSLGLFLWASSRRMVRHGA